MTKVKTQKKSIKEQLRLTFWSDQAKRNRRLYTEYQDIWLCGNKSGHTDLMQKTIISHLNHYGFYYEQDEFGNIFVGNFEQNVPCVVAHMDSVHTRRPLKVKCTPEGTLSARTGIGGDDKCGIVANIEVLREHYGRCNAIFTVDEEIGGVGAKEITKEKVENAMYFLEADRKGDDDLITTSGWNQIASQEFEDALFPYSQEHGFTASDMGSYTDVNELTEIAGKCAVNISSGYFKAHTVKEYVELPKLQNTIDFMKKVIDEVREDFIWTETSSFFHQGYYNPYGFGNRNTNTKPVVRNFPSNNLYKEFADADTSNAFKGILEKAEELQIEDVLIIELLKEAYEIGFYDATWMQ